MVSTPIPIPTPIDQLMNSHQILLAINPLKQFVIRIEMLIFSIGTAGNQHGRVTELTRSNKVQLIENQQIVE